MKIILCYNMSNCIKGSQHWEYWEPLGQKKELQLLGLELQMLLISVWVLGVKPLFSEKAIKNICVSQNFPNVIKVCACILFLIWTCVVILYKCCLVCCSIALKNICRQNSVVCSEGGENSWEPCSLHHGHYLIHS